MSIQAVDIIENFLGDILISPSILTWSDDGTDTSIQVSNVYHLREHMSVDIDGTIYEVKEVAGHFITVPGVIVSVQKLTILNPFYFHGTPYSTNVLLGVIKDFREKSPLVYLVEVLRDQRVTDPESLTERNITVILFVLDNSKGSWTTNEHYANTINRLSAYVDVLEDKFLNYPGFNADEIETIDRFSHANFGQYMNEKGYVNHIFDEVYSGIELRFTLPIKTDLGCV